MKLPKQRVRSHSRLLWIALAVQLSLVLPGLAQAEKTDVIVLTNGDHITGEIKKLERGQLKYSTDNMSTIYIEWKHIKGIWSIHHFRVRLEDGTFYYGSLLEPPDSLAVVVGSSAGPVGLRREDVVGITPVEQNFWSRMDGSLSLGFNYTQSTQIGQLAFDYKNSYQTNRNYIELAWQLNFTVQEQETPTRYQNFAITYDRELRKKQWYAAGSLGFQQNDELGIALRIPANAGFGRRLLQTNNELWQALLGLSVNSEWATSSPDSAALNLEGLVSTGFQYFRYDSPKSDITATITAYPSLNNWGRVRLNFNLSLQHELISDFFVNLTYWDNFDNRPPDPDAAQNDWAITTSIGWSY